MKQLPKVMLICAVAASIGCSGAQQGEASKGTPLQQAVALRDSGRLGEAEAQLAALAEAGDARARLEWIETLMLRGKHAEAVEHLKPLYQAAPDDPELAAMVARALDGAGEPDAAIAAYGRLVKMKPGEVHAIQRLAELMVSRGDVVGACALAEDAVQRYPEHMGLHLVLSRALLGRGRLPQALSHAVKATTLGPNDPQSWYQLAQVHILAGDLDKARDALQKSVSLDPQFADGLRDLGIVLLETGDAHKAVGVLRQAVQIAPDSAVAWTALGLARQRDKDAVGALAALEQAQRLQPRAVQVYLSLAEVALENGQPRRAQTEARKARERLGAQASKELRDRVETLLLKAIVVANLADALCRGQRDGAALQAAVAKELHDDGLESRAGDAAAIGADATELVKSAQARCAQPAENKASPAP